MHRPALPRRAARGQGLHFQQLDQRRGSARGRRRVRAAPGARSARAPRYCASALTRSSSGIAGGNFGSAPPRSIAAASSASSRWRCWRSSCASGSPIVSGSGVDVREPVRPAGVLAGDAELLDAAQHDVVAAVGERLGVGDHAGAADREDRRPALVVRLVARLQQHHADDAIALQRVGHHRAVARLEDVQRQEHVRETARRSAAGRSGSWAAAWNQRVSGWSCVFRSM